MTDTKHALEEMAERWESDMAMLSTKQNAFSRDSLGIAIADLRTEIKEMEPEKVA